MAKDTLSFVIPAYNEEHYIEDCLKAILEQKYDPSLAVEIIVVDNASTDRTAEIVKQYPHVKLVHEPKKGIVQARRAGFLASTGNLIANVDADTRITPGWIEKVRKAFARDPQLVGFSGPFIYYDAPRSMRIITRFFYYVGFFFYLLNRFVFRVGSMLQGGNFVVRREALEKIGGYDTNLSFWGEDTDIARRLSKVGKVTFTFKLPTRSSGRRLAKEGGFTTGLRYTANYFWMTFFGRPYTKNYQDVRFNDGSSATYAPDDKKREVVIATSAAVIILLIIGIIAYVTYRLAVHTL